MGNRWVGPVVFASFVGLFWALKTIAQSDYIEGMFLAIGAMSLGLLGMDHVRPSHSGPTHGGYEEEYDE